MGRFLVAAGLLTALFGVLIWSGALRWLRLGRLPGDIAIQRDGFSFFFPITTMLLLSGLIMLASLIAGALRR